MNNDKPPSIVESEWLGLGSCARGGGGAILDDDSGPWAVRPVASPVPVELAADGWRLDGDYWTRSDGGRIHRSKLLRYAWRLPTNRRRRRRLRRGTDLAVAPWTPLLDAKAAANRETHDRRLAAEMKYGYQAPPLGMMGGGGEGIDPRDLG